MPNIFFPTNGTGKNEKKKTYANNTRRFTVSFFQLLLFLQECQSVWAEKLFVHTNTVNPSSLNVNVNNTIVRCTCHMHKIMQIDPFYFFISLSFLSKCSLSHLNCISVMIIMKAHNTMNKSQSSLSNICL